MYFKVYAILAHKNPIQLKELIDRLQFTNTYFFIHIDKKSTLDDFTKIINYKNCFFIENRIVCKWGTFSLIEATIEIFKSITSFMDLHNKKADYHSVLLSGEDYPIKSNVEIHNTLKKNIKHSFINYWKLPYAKWWDGGLYRFDSLYYFNFQNKSLNKYTNKIIKSLKLFHLIPNNRIKKSFPNFNIYGSSQWLILNKLMLNSLLIILEEQKKMKSIFRYTLAPDETYFSSLLLNYSKEKENIINRNLTFVKFIGNNSSPEYLNIQDIKNLKNSNYLFARKFDTFKNQQSINYIIKTISNS